MRKTLISVIIPTRERAYYLRYCLKTVIKVDDPDLEIVVSDNASTDNTKEVVQEFDDPRIKYVCTPKRVSMRANFEYGVKNSAGEYVVIIGDDDGVLPKQFKYLRAILEEHKPDNISWSLPIYQWPDLTSESAMPNKMKVRKRAILNTPKKVNCNQLREELLDGSLKTFGAIPRVYHGCSSRNYLNHISDKNGIIFKGNIPDIYYSYRSIIEGGHFLQMEHPMTLGGQSPASTGRAQNTSNTSKTENPGVTFGEENKTDIIKDVVGYALSVPLVLFSTLETVRAETATQTKTPNYRAWYKYVLDDKQNNSEELRSNIKKILKVYAQKSGTLTDLETAPSYRAKLPNLVTKVLSEFSKYKRIIISPEHSGQNTILSGAHVLDGIFGDDFQKVLYEKMPRSNSWKRIYKNSIRYR